MIKILTMMRIVTLSHQVQTKSLLPKGFQTDGRGTVKNPHHDEDLLV